jgi:hypothetical protein
VVFVVIFWSRSDLLERFLCFSISSAAMSSRSRSPRGALPSRDLGAALATAIAALADVMAELAAERARAAVREAEWLSAYNEVTDDARELAALARGAGVGGEVVDDWFVPPPAPAEPEEEPDTQ